jgi:hypothetical protein
MRSKKWRGGLTKCSSVVRTLTIYVVAVCGLYPHQRLRASHITLTE